MLAELTTKLFSAPKATDEDKGDVKGDATASVGATVISSDVSSTIPSVTTLVSNQDDALSVLSGNDDDSYHGDIERRSQKTLSLMASAQAKQSAIAEAIKTHGAKSAQVEQLKKELVELMKTMKQFADELSALKEMKQETHETLKNTELIKETTASIDAKTNAILATQGANNDTLKEILTTLKKNQEEEERNKRSEERREGVEKKALFDNSINNARETEIRLKEERKQKEVALHEASAMKREHDKVVANYKLALEEKKKAEAKNREIEQQLKSYESKSSQARKLEDAKNRRRNTTATSCRTKKP